MICSEECDLNKELLFVSNIFENINGYPKRIINKCLDKVKHKLTVQPNEPPTNQSLTNSNEKSEKKQPMMLLPYNGLQGEKVLKRMKSKIPEDLRPQIIYNGTKLSSFFSVKDKIPFLHCSDLVYHYEDRRVDNKEDYTGETKCRIGKRIKEHQGSDKESAIAKYTIKENIGPPLKSNFSILAKNYRNPVRRKIAESMFVKEKKSTLNVQKDTYHLQLFN